MTLTLQELYQRPTITIPEAAGVLSCSDRHAYEMAARGDLPVVRISEHRMVVVTQQLLAMLGITRPPTESPAPAHSHG